MLAPAGNWENLKTAIHNGADAVYLGSKAFNARGKIENFDEEELKKAVSYAHLFNVKVYLTVNTLVFDDEMDGVIELIKKASSFKVDAFLVQDLGIVYELIKRNIKVELHASTQLAVCNLAGAKFLENLGFKRVVLARETGIEEIKAIRQNTNLEIEYFIHGALCVCFSGNCYLSGKLLGASGNRGKCAQLCRLSYKCPSFKNSEGYFLSAKDNNFSSRLKELYDAGVDSFKIEGRARREGYVAVSVGTYRNIIDNNFNVSLNQQTNLKLAFNRGDFTQGYLNGDGDIIDNKIQGHKGLEIGKVLQFKSGKRFNEIVFSTKHKIEKGDGLKILRGNKEVCSLSAMDLIKLNNGYQVNTKAEAKVGDIVFLTVSNSLENEFLVHQKKLKIDFNFIAKPNKQIVLKAKYNNIEVEALGDVAEFSTNISLTKDEAYSQLKKLGNTEFELDNFACDIENCFVRKQSLNSLRREVIDLLEQKIVDEYKTDEDISYPTLNAKKVEKIQYVTIPIVSEFDDVSSIKSGSIVIKPTIYSVKVVGALLERLKEKNVYLFIPPFLNQKDFAIIEDILNKFESLNVYANNISHLTFNRKIIAGSNMNIVNQSAIKFLNCFNVCDVVLGFDYPSNCDDIKKCEYANVYSFNGDIPAMTLVHCPIKNNFSSSCDKCLWHNNIYYEMQNGKKLKVSRYIVSKCYFNLILPSENKNFIEN